MSDLSEIKEAMRLGVHSDGDLEWCVDEIERLQKGCDNLHEHIARKDQRIAELEGALEMIRLETWNDTNRRTQSAQIAHEALAKEQGAQ